ncbi:Calx-beta domain-containing protein [Arcobacter peruensis]|uniref:Calx-beta domain-containing protein n=1 Tax=Arcobacter peruensis TaxID=2320140 RepID=UPI000F088F79|nr:Calx-beta domain-containing protein [Arcobacter peruensis]
MKDVQVIKEKLKNLVEENRGDLNLLNKKIDSLIKTLDIQKDELNNLLIDISNEFNIPLNRDVFDFIDPINNNPIENQNQNQNKDQENDFQKASNNVLKNNTFENNDNSNNDNNNFKELEKVEVTGLSVNNSNNNSSKSKSESAPTEITVLTGDNSNPQISSKSLNTESSFLTVDGSESLVKNGVEQGTGVDQEPFQNVNFSEEPTPVNLQSRANITTNKSSIEEGSDGISQVITYTVTRDNSISIGSVEWELTGVELSDLAQGQDTSGVINFIPGQTSADIEVTVLGDKLIEENENINISLKNPGNNTILGDSNVTTTIINDDSEVNITTNKSSIEEGSDGVSQVITYTVTRDNSISSGSVEWELTGVELSDLAQGQDTSGVINFIPGQTSADIEVTVLGDKLIEENENINISLKNPGNNTILGDSNVTTTIINDDSEVNITTNKSSIEEGSDGVSQVITYTVTRDNSISSGSVEWELTGVELSDLAQGQDTSGVINFIPGQTSADIEVTVLGDKLIEENENINISLKNPGNNTILGDSNVTTTIINDDSEVNITTNKSSIEEGSDGVSQVITYTVTRDNSISSGSVEWELTGVELSDLAQGQDTSGVINFIPGQTSADIEVTVLGDKLIEENENINISLKNPGNNTILGDSNVTTTIINDDSEVNITTNKSSIEEGSDGVSQVITYTVTRDNSISSGSVEWELTGVELSDLAQGQDTSGVINFIPGQTSADIEVTVLGDKLIEENENINISLKNPGNNIILGDSNVTTTIINDDSEVNITTNKSSIEEGSDGVSQVITYTVTRDNSISSGSVEWELTGVELSDLAQGQDTSGVINFIPGQTSADIEVTVLGDKLIEENENINISLKNPGNNIILGDSNVTTTIINDDSEVTVIANSMSLYEGALGESKTLTFVLSRENTLSESTVNWQLSGVENFTSKGVIPNGTVTFAEGENTVNVDFIIRGDDNIELDENWIISISNPGENLNLDNNNKIASTIIVDDDALISISSLEVSVNEGQNNETKLVTFKVSRTNDSIESSVDWTITGIDNNDIVDTASLSGTVSFLKGESTKFISVPLLGDRNIEENEDLTVTLSNASDNQIIVSPSATTTILNDDIGFSIIADNVNVIEGAQSTQTAITFYVVRSENLNQAMDIDYKLIPFGSKTINENDFVSSQDILTTNGERPSGTVSFDANETSKLVTIYVSGDNIVEDNETFSVVLSNAPSGTQILFGEISGSINSDEIEYTLSSIVSTSLEGNEPSNNTHEYLITRTGDLSSSATLNYNVTGFGENPIDSNDFSSSLTGSASFSSGESTSIISLNINPDSILEGLESYIVKISSTDNNTQILNDTAIGSIQPDDSSISIVANNSIVNEGSGTPNSHTFTVTRSDYLNSEVTINWNVIGNGTNQVDANDFGGVLPSGTITFLANEISKIITLNPSADLDYESHEGYNVVLTTSESGVSILDDTASGMILNDEDALTLVGTNLDVFEGNFSDPSQLSFSVQRSGDVKGTSSVEWELIPNSENGTQITDFAEGSVLSGSLEFTLGVSSQLVTIPLSYDNILENDAGFTIKLKNASAGTDILIDEVNGFIRNDDAVFDISADKTVLEGNSGITEVTLKITRSGDLTSTDLVQYNVSGVGANAIMADDFNSGSFPSDTVVFNANEFEKNIVLNIKTDSILEQDESFLVSLSNESAGTTIDNDSATVTIENDDDYLVISSDNANVQEGGNSAATDVTFTVTRTGDLSTSSSANWSVSGIGGNPINAIDFVGGTLPSGVVNFIKDQSTATITVQINGDYNKENDESFEITLDSASFGTEIGTATASTNIINDDTGLDVNATTTDLVENDTGTQIHVFTVTRTGVTTGTTSVDWAVTGSGTNAANAADFGGTIPSGTVLFAIGETSKTIEVTTLGDTDIESTEGFTVTLSNADANADIQTATATSTIVADDIELSIASSDVSVLEGEAETSKILTFTVTRSGDIASAVEVDWAATGMDVSDFADGTNLTGNIAFSANELTKTINLTLKGDNDNESNETLTVTLSNASSSQAYITTDTATTIVTNDDAAFVISADNASKNEGDTIDGASTAFTFTVTRTGDTTLATDIDWVLTLGTSTISDFVGGQDALTTNGGLPSGTVSFADGELTQTITINVATDDVVEGDDSFSITLQNAGDNVELSTVTASSIITNDDTGFSIATLDSSKDEGDSGTTIYTFTVTRAGDIASAASVDWAVTGNGGEPVNVSDFGGAFPSGTINFAENVASEVLSITVSADTIVEEDESFLVTISNAKLANNTPQIIVDATAVGTILNEDQSFAVSSANTTINEGDTDTTQIAFTVTRTGNLNESVAVDYTISGGAGVDSVDYEGSSLPSNTLTFAAGEFEKVVTLNVNGDTLAENNEVYTMTISNQSSGIITTASDTTTVTNDDTNFVISSPLDTAEGTSSETTAFVYTITRTGDTTGTASVNWNVSTATGLTSADFVGNQDVLTTNGGLPSGTVSFANGVSSMDITINVSGDLTLESDETLEVVLSAATNATIESGEGTTSSLILDDDDSFSISTLTTSKDEGQSDNTITYTVTRTGSLDGARDLTWTVTGLNGFDPSTDLASGQASTGTVSFADGQSTKNITINILGDTVEESNETMTITLSNAPDNTNIDTAAVSTEIVNDDATYKIEKLLAEKVEGNSDYVEFTYQVTRTGDLLQSNSVDWSIDSTVSDSVDASDFYNGSIPSGRLDFTSGQTTKTITIQIKGDSVLEADEALKVDLSNPTTGSVLDSSKDTATGTVSNDDAELNITAGTATKLEGDSGHGTSTAYTYTVTRTGNLDQTTTVDWDVNHGTTNINDFSNGVNAVINPSGTLSFTSGQATKTITVYVNGDTGVGSVEDDETFSVVLSNTNEGSSIGSTSSFDSTIQNDDTKLILTVDDYSKAEKKSGESTTFNYTVTKEGYIDQSSTFNWSVNTASYLNNYTNIYDYTDNRNEYMADANDFGGSYPGDTITINSGDTTANFSVTVPGDDIAEDDQWFLTKIDGTSGYDEISVIYKDPTESDTTDVFRVLSPDRASWHYIDTDVELSSSSNGVSSGTNMLYTSIERDEATFYLSDREVANDAIETLSPGNTLYQRDEGDTPSDGGVGSTILTIDETDYGYVEHIFAVQRQISQSGTASVDWKIGTYSNSISANDFVNLTFDFDGNITAISTASELPSGTVNFVDGQEWGYVKFYTAVDDTGEYDEGFKVYLENPSAGSSVYTYDTNSYNYNIGFVVNDDTRFDASSNDVNEGETLTFTISRNGDSRGTDTVDWYINFPGSETTNESNSDESTWYKLDASDVSTPLPSNGTATYDAGNSRWYGTMTFEDGETTKTITVDTIDDTIRETWKESVSITLGNPDNVDNSETNHDEETATTGYTDTGYVYDDDPDTLYNVSFDKTEVFEGTTAGTTVGTSVTDGNTIEVTVSRTNSSDTGSAPDYTSTVGWYLYNSNINNGWLSDIKDYGTVNRAYEYNSSTTYGNVYFEAGETEKTFTITLNGDNLVESDENLTFRLMDNSSGDAWMYDVYGGVSEQNGYGPGDIDSNSSYIEETLTVKNDDVRLWIEGWDTYSGDANGYNTNLFVSAYEGNDLNFNIVRAGRMDNDITLGYTITIGTTTAGDFNTTSGTFILSGDNGTNNTVTLTDILTDDSIVESNESFTLTLTTPSYETGSSVLFQSYYGSSTQDISYSGSSSSLAISGTVYDNDTTYSITPSSTSQVETDEGSNQTFTFTVQRESTGYTQAATVKWKVVSVDGSDVTDFTSSDSNGDNSGLPSGTISFGNGETGVAGQKTISVLINGDAIAENNESFKVVLYEDTLTTPNPDITNTHNVASADITIITDDTGISISDATITESDANQTLTFTVTRSGDLTVVTTMDWALNNITTNADDFVGATSGSLSFSANESSKDITITVAGDVTAEQIETFKINLSNFTNVDELIDIEASGTINNDDNTFTLSASADSEEGSAQTYTITRTHITEQDQTINWAVSAGTADADDFSGSFPFGSVTFTGNELSKTFTVTANDDSTSETDEDYNVTISLGAGATGDTITTDTVQGGIINNDATYEIVADSVSQLEDHLGDTSFTFTVTRTGNTTGIGSVDWALSSTDANASDFNGGLSSGTVNFANGDSEETITINVVGDLDVESDEEFTVTLSNPTNGEIINGGTASSTITNDDSTIAISTLSASKDEGDSGTTAFTFTVTRTGYLGEAETVAYAITGSGVNSADAADFGGTLPSGTLTLPANQAETTLTILVSGDELAELEEEFTVTLSNPSSGVNITTATATGTIEADDIVFDISGPTDTLEVDTGANTTFDFVVTRSGNLSGSQILNWSVEGIGSDPLSLSEFDASSGTVTFNADDTTQTISVLVKGDFEGEANESFRLTLTGDSELIFTNNSADAVVIDNEASLRIEATDAVKNEGESGTTDYTFTVTRTGNTALEATVDWDLSSTDITAEDFEGDTIPSGTLTFADGVNSQIITISVKGDTLIEGNEIFNVDLSNASVGADIIVSSATATIVSDDVQWNVEEKTIPSVEGDSSSDFVYTISRTGASQAMTIDWSVSSTEANTSDFIGNLFPSDTLTFAQGEMSKDIIIKVSGDSIKELSEDFTISLTAPNDSFTHSFNNQSVTTTITDDDDIMSISSLDAIKTEGIDSNNTFTFTVTRDGSLTGSSSVDWQINHTDTNSSDFSATTGTVNFADGESSKVVSITVVGDRDIESDEDFAVELVNPGAGSTIGTATATGTIQDDDIDLALSATDVVIVEGDSTNAGTATFTVTRTGNTSGETTVAWDVIAGSAIAADFDGGVLPSGTITFAANEISKTIIVDYLGDGLDEGNETYTVQLSNQTSTADIISNNISGTIVDDDDTLTLSAVNTDHFEADSGTVSYTFKIDRSGTSTGEASVQWQAIGSGTNALSSDEFASSLGTVNFEDGEVSKTFTVEINSDTVGEYDEEFTVSLLNPSYGSTASTDTATGIVRNEDAVLLINSDQVSKNEGDNGIETSYFFTVTRSGDTTGSSTALWEVIPSGDKAASAFDFGGVYPSGAVAFGAGESTKQIEVKVLGDDVGEFNETFSVELSDATNAVILEGVAETQITNDDTGISIAELDSSKLEGNDGDITNFTFRVERVGELEAKTVTWSLIGTGIYPAGADDFVGGVLPSDTINFVQGESFRDITIQVEGDNIVGEDQTFNIIIDGDDIVDNTATGIIQNDDSEISIVTVNESVSKFEGDSGSTIYSFEITRIGTTEETATVDWEVSSIGSNPISADDFVGGVLPSGTVTFTNGESTKTITVEILSDTITELDETFSVDLINPGVGVSLSQTNSSATAEVLTDDNGLILYALDANKDEGEGSTQTAFTYQVLRSGNTDSNIAVNYAITGDINQDDFISDLNGSFNMDSGEESKIFTLYVNGDDIKESDESFQLTLSSSGLSSTSVDSVIRADEEGIRINAVNETVIEGTDTDTVSVLFDITALGVTEQTIVNWSLLSNTNRDIDSNDLVNNTLPSGSVTFDSDGTQQITIEVLKDSIVESNEFLSVLITSNSSLDILNNTAIVNVQNDDIISENEDIIEDDNSGNNIYALGGNDIIYGKDGSDYISGGSGNDKLFGGDSEDILTGDEGSDRFVFESKDYGIDIVTDFEVGIDEIAIVSSGFGNIVPSTFVKQDFDTNIETTLTALSLKADVDIYMLNADENLNLANLESSITDTDHSGSAFFLISDGTDTKLYFDSDTDSGIDGNGMQLIAEFNDVTDATTMINTIEIEQGI